MPLGMTNGPYDLQDMTVDGLEFRFGIGARELAVRGGRLRGSITIPETSISLPYTMTPRTDDVPIVTCTIRPNVIEWLNAWYGEHPLELSRDGGLNYFPASLISHDMRWTLDWCDDIFCLAWIELWNAIVEQTNQSPSLSSATVGYLEPGLDFIVDDADAILEKLRRPFRQVFRDAGDRDYPRAVQSRQLDADCSGVVGFRDGVRFKAYAKLPTYLRVEAQIWADPLERILLQNPATRPCSEIITDQDFADVCQIVSPVTYSRSRSIKDRRFADVFRPAAQFALQYINEALALLPNALPTISNVASTFDLISSICSRVRKRPRALEMARLLARNGSVENKRFRAPIAQLKKDGILVAGARGRSRLSPAFTQAGEWLHEHMDFFPLGTRCPRNPPPMQKALRPLVAGFVAVFFQTGPSRIFAH